MKPTKRSFISLLNTLSFVILAGSGILAFARPFSMKVTGLHAMMGFVFIGLVALHVINNMNHLKRYIRSKAFRMTTPLVLSLSALFLWQPKPIRGVLGLSKNLGPALDRFEITETGLTYQYHPATDYRMTLTVRAGTAFNTHPPPHLAIWLENASFYHIKTLHQPTQTAESRASLPYWDFKMRGWEEAKRKAEISDKELAEELGVDAISGATQNSSFDPADYILPADPANPMPYRLLLEINNPGDSQPSLIYSVTIDNADPHAYQLLELMGYPERETDEKTGKENWAIYYVNETFTTALDQIDSALLTIDR